MECRASGLSDHQWCLDNDINGTFYNWVKRLRKKGCNYIPAVTGRFCQEFPKQDVVRLEFSKPPASVSSNSAPMHEHAPSYHG